MYEHTRILDVGGFSQTKKTSIFKPSKMTKFASQPYVKNLAVLNVGVGELSRCCLAEGGNNKHVCSFHPGDPFGCFK